MQSNKRDLQKDIVRRHGMHFIILRNSCNNADTYIHSLYKGILQYQSANFIFFLGNQGVAYETNNCNYVKLCLKQRYFFYLKICDL